MKGRKIELNKIEIKNKEKGITLTSLVITIIILLILAGAAINLTIGDEGIFIRAIEATDRYKAEEIIEKMQIIKANTIIDDKGKFNIDDFFDNLVEEGIVGDKEEIIDNGDGSHTITTDEGYIIDIIEKDEGKDVEIEYIGKGDKVGPRIKEIHVRNKTTSTIEIEVEAINSEGAKYTYSYKKEDEEEYKEAATKIAENTYKYENLEANKIYNIKVEVENKGIKKEKIINVRTGELPEGAISIGEVVWENGKAKVEVNINKEIEGNLRLEYKINEEGSWIEIQDGEIIENLEHNQTIYVRLTDGTNETEYLSTKIEDNINPEVSISLGTITSNSIEVIVTANDKETGLPDKNTYEYFLNDTSQGASTSNTHTFSNLSKGTYTLKVVVTDKAGNTNEAEIKGTTEEITSGLQEGAITFTEPTWSGGTASIKVSTNTIYQIEYQLNGTEGEWTEIANNGTINNLAHNTNIYARLTDGINQGEYATASIKDTTKPEVSISLGTITSNSIQVQVTAQDKETGLLDKNTYEYFLNNSSQGADTSNTHTFSNLSKGTYTLKVVVTDKAGNVNGAEITGTTSTIPAGTISGAITFTNPTWSGGRASINVSTNTGYKIEYQINGTAGTWTEISNGGTIGNLGHNTNIYARLTDGINRGEYASTNVKDTIAPTKASVNLNGYASGSWTRGDVTQSFSSIDNETGIAKYQYSHDGVNVVNDLSNTWVINYDGQWNFYIRAVDNAGNAGPWSDMYTIRRDATPPNGFNISMSNVTYDGFTINASTSDNMSGINRYDYIVNGELKYSGNVNSYNVTGLQSNVEYQVYVNAYDNAGNVVSSNVLSQRVLSKWTTSSNKSYATEITIREPSSEQNPTILRVLPYADEDIRAYIKFNEQVKKGSTVSVTYMYTRSNNNYYFNFSINENINQKTVFLNSGSNTKKTLTHTMTQDADYLEIQLHKTDISSSNYYADIYIYDITIDGRKIL